MSAVASLGTSPVAAGGPTVTLGMLVVGTLSVVTGATATTVV